MRERNYGWSPRQLARVNARREARGRDVLVDRKLNEPDYAQKYLNEEESYAAKKQARESVGQEDEDEGSLAERQADRTRRFKERFGEKGSMAARYGYKSSFPVKKPMIQNSLDKM